MSIIGYQWDGELYCPDCGDGGSEKDRESYPDQEIYQESWEECPIENGQVCGVCSAVWIEDEWVAKAEMGDYIRLECNAGGAGRYSSSCGQSHYVHYTQAGSVIKQALIGELTCPNCRKTRWRVSRLTITLEALPDDTAVRGNALASGNDRIDREYEDEIIARLIDNDEWAWCTARVTVEYTSRDNDDENEYIATDHLGACSYEDKEDFIENSGSFEDMIDTCLAELRTQTSF